MKMKTSDTVEDVMIGIYWVRGDVEEIGKGL